jgi:hypothetical protein
VPDYEKSIKKVRAENPDVAETKIAPAGFFARLLAPKNARAIASPYTGNITYFPERIEREGFNPDQIENMFTHELQHTRQTRALNPLQRLMNVGRQMLGEEEYIRRPRELEAFQAEKDRSRRLGLNVPEPYTGARDIQLPPMSKRRQVIDNFAREQQIRGVKNKY